MAKVGKQSYNFDVPPSVAGFGSIVGPKEFEGPIGNSFDVHMTDLLYGEESWEKTETKMQLTAIKQACGKYDIEPQKLDLLIGGDLLNQTIATNFSARQLQVPYLGLYNACATMAESLVIGSFMVQSKFAKDLGIVASSHNLATERQYRFPIELGVQRPQTAQWTVTGSGSIILTSKLSDIVITSVTVGKVVDLGVKDPNDMGSAMAPAAHDTLIRHLKDTNRKPDDFDLIITGDLGKLGHQLLCELLAKDGYDKLDNLNDCGLWIYSNQDTHCGGSGAGCSAVVIASHVLPLMKRNVYKKVLFIGTGALLSPTSVQQGESISGIAHGVVFEKRGE